MSLRNPEKFPVKFYSWRDDDAPQLTNADGAIKTILKACLVTGYRSKTGAGWEMPFEDTYRMVLRRPLRTGNPPDLKIENGVINGAVSHRVVAQDNPTGLDDDNELLAVNLLARDPNHGNEWYLIATDFAFVLCYQMGPNNYRTDKGNLIFFGSIPKLFESEADNFLLSVTSNLTNKTGTLSNVVYSFLSTYFNLFDVRTKTNYNNAKKIITLTMTETETGDYYAQPILIDKLGQMPFFASVSSNFDDTNTKEVVIANRPMLRYVSKIHNTSQEQRALYIPLDYWEL